MHCTHHTLYSPYSNHHPPPPSHSTTTTHPTHQHHPTHQQTVVKALFVDYPTDPEADYLTFKGRVWEAVGVLTTFCFVFCLCLVACFVLADEGSGYTAATVMLGVLVVATIYRALRVPGLTPGAARNHSSPLSHSTPPTHPPPTHRPSLTPPHSTHSTPPLSPPPLTAPLSSQSLSPSSNR
jgi:hypothetical protein